MKKLPGKKKEENQKRIVKPNFKKLSHFTYHGVSKQQKNSIGFTNEEVRSDFCQISLGGMVGNGIQTELVWE